MEQSTSIERFCDEPETSTQQRRRFPRVMQLILALTAITALSIAGIGCDEEFTCSSDYDCGGTNVCNVNTGECERFICEFDNQCAVGKTCQNNTCVDVDAQ